MWFMGLMAAFAVVISVVALGVAWLTISGSAAIAKRMDLVQRELASMNRIAPTVLRAEVDALVGALDVLRASNRKELGAIWGRLGGKPRTDPLELAHTAANDDRFEAMLALQQAPTPKPEQ